MIAAERNDRSVWALHRRSLEYGLVPTVPAGVLGQAGRGGRQAQMSRLLTGCRIESLDEARARSAGAVCAQAGTSDVIDASIVVGAAARGDLVITSDGPDIFRLRDRFGLEFGLLDISGGVRLQSPRASRGPT